MQKRLILTSSLFLASALALPASASTIVYSAILNGANEVGPNASPATGTATFTLNGDSLAVAESYTGLSGAPTGAHIHCCAVAGINTQVAVPFVGFPTTTSGSYAHTFDLTLTATYTPGFLTFAGGTAAGAEAALIASLNTGQTYANIHDANFPGGEIRGTIAAPTPEPESLFLLGTGMLGILQAVRRRVRC